MIRCRNIFELVLPDMNIFFENINCRRITSVKPSVKISNLNPSLVVTVVLKNVELLLKFK